MALSSHSPLLSLLCFLLVLSLMSNAATASRKAPAEPAGSGEKKQEECLEEGTVQIPGIGRYELGSPEIPSIGGLDHSGPAAANGQYLPGNDDTFVPNPGYEVPNPAQGTTP